LPHRLKLPAAYALRTKSSLSSGYTISKPFQHEKVVLLKQLKKQTLPYAFNQADHLRLEEKKKKKRKNRKKREGRGTYVSMTNR